MLFMKKEFFPAIRSGRKTTTLRFWRRRQVRPGSEHLVRGLGTVRILGVACVSLGALTESDARADGFESLSQLLEAIDRLYPPEERDGKALYKVTFRYPAGEATRRSPQS
jgi:hypothetical protein